MSKITFRADEELVERLEAHDASKSEVLRAALRAYLDGPEREHSPRAEPDPTSSELTELLDRVVEQRLREFFDTDAEPAESRKATAERQTRTARRERSTAGRRDVASRRRDSVVVEITSPARDVRVDRGGVRDSPTDAGGRASDTRRGRLSADEGSVSDTDDSHASDARRAHASDTRRRDTSDANHGTRSDASSESASDTSHTAGDVSNADDDHPCKRCGTELSDDHIYCPNCGEKAARRLFCDCGDEVRSDWSFCPGCGRRTPAADVLTEDGGR